MTCGCGSADPRRRIFRLHVPNSHPDLVTVDNIAPDDYYAVAVGPESDFESYFLYPFGESQVAAKVPVGSAIRQAPQQNAIKVGVRTPHYGPVTGPIRVASHMSQLGTGTRQAMTGIASTRLGTVDLLFYPRELVPPNLPLMRPDARYCARWTFNTADAVETDVLICPGFGRTRQLFSAARVSGAVAYVSGSLTLNFYGEQFMGRYSSTDQFATTLLGTKVYSSGAFDYNAEYEGRFDYYRVTVTEASLTGPDGALELQMLGEDM